MKTVSTILVTASGLAVLAAVWAPGDWWQWAITALVLLLAGAGTGGAADKRRHPIDEPTLLPEHVAREFVAPSTLERITVDDVAEYKRREFGKQADR